MVKDYYAILGIDFTADVSDIKTAYRRQSRKWHPDVNKAEIAGEKMIDINEAYSILSNSSSKEKYDKEYLQMKQMRTVSYGRDNPEKERTPNPTNVRRDYDRSEYTYDYNVQDDSLREDINNARETAEQYVKDLMESLKETAKTAAKGALDEALPYIIVGIVMTCIGLLVFAFS